MQATKSLSDQQNSTMQLIEFEKKKEKKKRTSHLAKALIRAL